MSLVGTRCGCSESLASGAPFPKSGARHLVPPQVLQHRRHETAAGRRPADRRRHGAPQDPGHSECGRPAALCPGAAPGLGRAMGESGWCLPLGSEPVAGPGVGHASHSPGGDGRCVAGAHWHGTCTGIQHARSCFPRPPDPCRARQVHYLEQPTSDYVAEAVRTALALHALDLPGDILVFLTGQDECEAAAQTLTDQARLAGRSGRLKLKVRGRGRPGAGPCPHVRLRSENLPPPQPGPTSERRLHCRNGAAPFAPARGRTPSQALHPATHTAGRAAVRRPAGRTAGRGAGPGGQRLQEGAAQGEVWA